MLSFLLLPKEFIGLFLLLAGFILGLGAVTVIDLHSFLGRTSEYWTEATIRTHKVTKPLIWVGLFLLTVGSILYYPPFPDPLIQAQLMILILLTLNGIFLTFKISPFLLEKEARNKAKELLPPAWQRKIAFSFVLSFLGWWTALILLVGYLIGK